MKAWADKLSRNYRIEMIEMSYRNKYVHKVLNHLCSAVGLLLEVDTNRIS